MNITIELNKKTLNGFHIYYAVINLQVNIKIKSWTEDSDMYTNVSSDDQMQTATLWLSVTKISRFIL